MIDSENKLMLDCHVSTHSAYFEGGFNPSFRKKYNGVIVDARSEGGYGHFAIRKPYTFWFKLPKFIKKMFPYNWVMLKNDREKMYELRFYDYNHSIELLADKKNPSCNVLTFDEETYQDLKACIPPFLEKVGYKFDVSDTDEYESLVFEIPAIVFGNTLYKD